MFFRKKVKIVTHNGTFHSDDVFSLAVLSLKFGKNNILIKRTRDEALFKEADFLVDVGGEYDVSSNHFDHHQKGGAGKRENGIPYASIGIIWKHFGDDVCGGRDVSKRIDERLISYIDAMDNGTGELKPVLEGALPYTIGNFIMDLNPSWVEKDEKRAYKQFLMAVDFARGVLLNLIEKTKAQIEGERVVKRAYEESVDKRIILLKEDLSWENILNKFPEPLFVLSPDKINNTWKISAVRDNPHSFKNRIDLPKEWAGKRGEDLIKVSNIKDAVFVHNALFMGVAKTQSGALEMAKKAIDCV